MHKILMSIKPQWFGKIFFGGESGKKTVEVRKSRPIIEPPFEIFVYCTKRKGRSFIDDTLNLVYGNKILGSFVCSKIIALPSETTQPCWLKEKTLLTDRQYIEYLGHKDGFGWYITEPTLFDKPRELTEFTLGRGFSAGRFPLTRPPQSWCYVEERGQ